MLMKRQDICAACGREFTAGRVTQKYCSAYCRRYAHRHGANNHKRTAQEKNGAACLSLPEMRQYGVGDRNDRPAGQVLLGSL